MKEYADMGIELGTSCMPSEHASDQATAPVFSHNVAHFWVDTRLVILGWMLMNMQMNGQTECCSPISLPDADAMETKLHIHDFNLFVIFCWHL